ncbi:hypothetical protein [Paraburkholderia aromaticivorans]|uniref:hypothetical protein n=1 Tax=Paraburkholderia aromaticivorans TaxID=2026199 RepID=UPI00145621EC|nr:hypothetical protein [Paraburkholderia aromaticivorans]
MIALLRVLEIGVVRFATILNILVVGLLAIGTDDSNAGDVTMTMHVDRSTGGNGVEWCTNPSHDGSKLYRKLEPVRKNPRCTPYQSDLCSFLAPLVTSDKPDHICYTSYCYNKKEDICSVDWEITLSEVTNEKGAPPTPKTQTIFVDNGNYANQRICADPPPTANARVVYRNVQWANTRPGREFAYGSSRVPDADGRPCFVARCTASTAGDACSGQFSLTVDVYP